VVGEAALKAALAAEPPTRLVVVDFFAAWCGPCTRFAPVLDQLAREFPAVRFLKVDENDSKDAIQARRIKAFPTIKLYVAAAEVESFEGADEGKLRAAIAKHMAAAASAVARAAAIAAAQAAAGVGGPGPGSVVGAGGGAGVADPLQPPMFGLGDLVVRGPTWSKSHTTHDMGASSSNGQGARVGWVVSASDSRSGSPAIVNPFGVPLPGAQSPGASAVAMLGGAAAITMSSRVNSMS
jgi:thiol-disulfide isomerase/thioredoxin